MISSHDGKVEKTSNQNTGVTIFDNNKKRQTATSTWCFFHRQSFRFFEISMCFFLNLVQLGSPWGLLRLSVKTSVFLKSSKGFEV